VIVLLEYWRVGALKVVEEESRNLLCSKVTMATQIQPTSRHLSIQHCNETVCGRYTYPSERDRGKQNKQVSNTLQEKHMA